MNAKQAAFELGCLKTEHDWGCHHRDPAEYARQVNWNRRYLKPRDGAGVVLLREIRALSPNIPPLHLHDLTPPDCSLCVPFYPLTYPRGFPRGPGLYAAFKKACDKGAPK